MHDHVPPQVPRGDRIIREDLDEGEGGALLKTRRDMVKEVVDEFGR